MIYLNWIQSHGLELLNHKAAACEPGSVVDLVLAAHSDNASVYHRVDNETVQYDINFLLDGWAMSGQGIKDEHQDAVELVYEALIEAKGMMLTPGDLGEECEDE